MTRLLTRLEITEVSGVTKAANQGAKVQLRKSDDGDHPDPIGRLVRADTPSGWRVEWVEKAAGDEQPIRFQKDDDDGGTAISGKKRQKNSLKRAMKIYKDRLRVDLNLT